MYQSKAITACLGLALTGLVHAQNTGTSFCNVIPNSTGLPTTLSGSFGSGVGSDLHLEATQGVPGELGYFLVGTEATTGIAVSDGTFCLAGTSTARFLRYNIPGGDRNSIGVFDAAGVLQNAAGTSLSGTGYDVPGTLPDTFAYRVFAGSTWHFQAWHRDTPSAAGASNFSNGLSVTFPFPQITPIPGMVSIPAGTFIMGSDEPFSDPYWNGIDAWEVHPVTLPSFWMGEYEVTQAEYESIMGVNPSHFSGPNLPVEMVSWHEARAYCAELTAQQIAMGNIPLGYEYRLPTEAEWEYTCRAGTTTEFNVGSELLCADGQFTYTTHGNIECFVTAPVPVGSFPANAFGLYDMHGNVNEWCLDVYSVSYIPGPAMSPFYSGSPHIRIARGGSWFDLSIACRSASRGSQFSWHTADSVGFRVVLGEVIVP
ncbi:MAG: formylglycine-generating enzyme family protein [Planctomycetota bacterium]|nr:formylglycine-generating enzyme family protein [Planctomycetota bacterium]